MSSTRRCAWLREHHVSYKNRTRNVVCKIHKNKTQDHLGNHQVTRKSYGGTCINTVDHIISGVPLSVVEQQSTGWSRSLTTTNTKTHSFRIWARRRRSTSSANNRRTWSPTERIQNSKHWILTLNAEGLQQPLNQRSDFAQAKRECKRLHDEHMARTQEE